MTLDERLDEKAVESTIFKYTPTRWIYNVGDCKIKFRRTKNDILDQTLNCVCVFVSSGAGR